MVKFLEADEASTDAVQTETVPTYRYDHVVDGFYRHTIARIVTSHLESRQPVGLILDRQQALSFAESVRLHIEHSGLYGDVEITADTFRAAIDEVVHGWQQRPTLAQER